MADRAGGVERGSAVIAAGEPGTAERAREAIANGRPLLLIDSSRSHAYFAIAARSVDVPFMRMVDGRARGVLRVAAAAERLERLGLSAAPGTDLCPPVGLRAAEGTSAREYMVMTMRALADPGTRPDDLSSPGHVFPTIAPDRGEGASTGIARALVDLARLSRVEPVVTYIEAAGRRDAAMSADEARSLAEVLGIDWLSMRDLILYRDRVEAVVDRVVETLIPTDVGELMVSAYRSRRSGREYVAFATPGVGEDREALVSAHVHRRCTVGEVFGGTPCECGEQLQGVIEDLPHRAPAVVVYFGEASNEPCGALDGPDPQTPAGWLEAAELGSVLRDVDVERIVLSSNMPLDEALWRDVGFDVRIEPERRRGTAMLARAIAAAET